MLGKAEKISKSRRDDRCSCTCHLAFFSSFFADFYLYVKATQLRISKAARVKLYC